MTIDDSNIPTPSEIRTFAIKLLFNNVDELEPAALADAQPLPQFFPFRGRLAEEIRATQEKLRCVLRAEYHKAEGS